MKSSLHMLAAVFLVVVACLAQQPAELDSVSRDTTQTAPVRPPDILTSENYLSEVSRAMESLEQIEIGERNRLTDHERNVIYLKVIRDLLAESGAPRNFKEEGNTPGMPIRLSMIATYFVPGGGGHLDMSTLTRRIEEEDIDDQTRDAAVALSLLQVIRTSACYSYQRNTEEIIWVNPACQQDGNTKYDNDQTACSPCWINCKDLNGLKKCNNCCESWLQLEIVDPMDEGVVYVFCFDGEPGNITPRSCPPAS